MSELVNALRKMATYDCGYEEQSDIAIAAANTIDRLTAENAELQKYKQKTESTMTREGFNDLETMIAKYKTVMLAANETSIEQDEEIDVLKTALAESQRRERAAVKDLSIDSHCTLCKHHRSEGGDCYGVSKCAIKGIKTQWQWRGPEAGKERTE